MLKCAFYEKEITPPLGCNISGYANLRKGTDVKDRLMAKACVFSNGKETVALIALDALRILNEVRNEIARRIHAFTGIPEKNVLVAAIHTHTGIPEKYYNGDEDAQQNQAHYFDVFTKLIADCAILAYQRLKDSDLTFGIGNVEGISFCRNYIMKNSTPQTNPGRLNPDIIGPASKTDNELPVLFVKSANGTPLGAIVTFACHLDCVGGTEYSGDFASELSKQMKKLYGEDFVTVFFMGTAGDINHFNVNVTEDEPDHFRKMGKKIAGEVLKVVSFAEPICGDTLKCKFSTVTISRTKIDEDKIAKAKHTIATIKEIPGIKIAADGTEKDQYELMMAKKMLAFLDEAPDHYNVPLQFIQIGDVKFFGFPSEIYCYFGLSLKEKCGAKKQIVASYCNGLYGYIPTRELFYDTIYESRPGSNRLTADAGYIMVEKLLEMSKQ